MSGSAQPFKDADVQYFKDMLASAWAATGPEEWAKILSSEPLRDRAHDLTWERHDADQRLEELAGGHDWRHLDPDITREVAARGLKVTRKIGDFQRQVAPNLGVRPAPNVAPVPRKVVDRGPALAETLAELEAKLQETWCTVELEQALARCQTLIDWSSVLRSFTDDIHGATETVQTYHDLEHRLDSFHALCPAAQAEDDAVEEEGELKRKCVSLTRLLEYYQREFKQPPRTPWALNRRIKNMNAFTSRARDPKAYALARSRIEFIRDRAGTAHNQPAARPRGPVDPRHHIQLHRRAHQRCRPG